MNLETLNLLYSISFATLGIWMAIKANKKPRI